ncbi:MAG TPA: hypothetical protein VHF23_08495 [Gaiellaceae bacterium]|nr:hypothetical protein [Gaiellaceae bacterium]
MNATSTGSQTLAARMLTDAYDYVLSGWCQGAAAHDECGRPVEPASAFARRWSALGALERAWRRSPEPPGVTLDAFQRAKLALTAAVNDLPQVWNDRSERHESDVLSALAEAVGLVDLPVAVPPSALDDLLEDLDTVGPRWGLDDGFLTDLAEPPLER